MSSAAKLKVKILQYIVWGVVHPMNYDILVCTHDWRIG